MGKGTGLFSGEGEWNPDRFIVLEFETEGQLRACFESNEYRKIVPLRTGSATTRSIVVTGYSPGSHRD